MKKFFTEDWLSSSPTSRAINIILAFICGLGIFFLLRSCLQPDPSSPPPRKKPRTSRKYHAETRRSSRSKKKNQTLKACRHCLQDLEEVHSLVSLLQSHLARLSDQGGFHQFLRQAAPGQVRGAAPAGAPQPCRGPVEDAAPAMAPSPSHTLLTEPPRPLASTPPAGPPEEQSNLKKMLPDTVRKIFLPGSSYWASLVPAIWGLGHASYPVFSLSWWWESTKSLFLPSVLQHECPQEHASCHAPEASFWGGLSDGQVETPTAPFVTPDVQKLLELLITKRIGLKVWKERMQGGSVLNRWCPADHAGFRGTLWKLLGAEQKAASPPSFWSVRDKAELRVHPQPFPSPEGLEDRLPCSQLFWGLPSLHSESLVATAFLSARSSQLQAPSVLFNGTSDCLPVLTQAQASLQISHTPPLLQRGIQLQPQPSSLTLPQPQAPLGPPVPVRAPSLLSQRRTSGVSCPATQKKTLAFASSEMQHVAWASLPEQQDRGKTSPTVERASPEPLSQDPPKLPEDRQASQAHQSVSTFQGDFIMFNIQQQQLQRKLGREGQQDGLPHKVQLSVELMWPQEGFPAAGQAQGEQGLSRPLVFKGEGGQAAWSTRSRRPGRDHTRPQPEKNSGKGLRRCLKRTPTGLLRVSIRLPGKALGTSSEEDLGRPSISTLDSDPEKDLAEVPDKQQLEKTLKVHLHRKLAQISEGLIPVTVRRSWFVADHALPKSQPQVEMRKLVPLKDQKPCVNTSHELPFLCPPTQQKLEAHIIRLRVRHKWDLPLQALEPADLRPHEAQHPPPSPYSATFVPGAPAKAQFYKFLGKPPQPHPGGKALLEESSPTPGSPPPVPSPTREEMQQAPGGPSPGEGRQASETPSSGQAEGSPPRSPALCLINRTLWSKTVLGAKTASLGASPSLALAREEPKGDSGGQASPDKVAVPDTKPRAQSPRAEGATDPMEAKKAPTWKVILRPSVLAKKQTIYVDLRRSGPPRAHRSPLPPAELVAQDPKEASLTTEVSTFELLEKTESGSQAEGQSAAVLCEDSFGSIVLPDTANGVLVEGCDTEVLLQDCHTHAVPAADVLAPHAAASCSQREHASGETSASLVSPGHSSSGSSCEGRPEPRAPKVDESSDSQSDRDSTDEEEDRRSPETEEEEDRCAEPPALRASQAGGPGHPPQVRRPGESLGSKYLQPDKGQTFPEGYFRQRMKSLLQCLNPTKKSKGLEGPLQKGKPAPAPAQSWVPARSRSVMDNRAVEAQTIVTAVGQILVEKLGLHQGIRASEIYPHQELQAPVHGHSCPHRALCATDQKRGMGEAAPDQQGTPKGRSCPTKSQPARDRSDGWESLPRELGPPLRPSQHRPAAAGVPARAHHHPTWGLRKWVSSYQAECAAHTFPGRKDFLQEKIEYVQRKPIVSHVSTPSVC